MAKRGRKPKRRIDWSSNFSILKTILALLIAFLSVIALISIFGGFGQSGKLNGYLRILLTQGFGILAIFVPFILFYLAFLLLVTKRFKYANWRIFGTGLLLFASLMGIMGAYAGTFGDFIRTTTASLISTFGAIVMYVILAVIALILMTGKDFHSIFDKLAEKISALASIFSRKPKEKEELSPENEKLLTGADEDGSEEEKEFNINNYADTDVKDVEVEEIVEEKGEDETEKELTEEERFKLMNPPTGPVGEEEFAEEEVVAEVGGSANDAIASSNEPVEAQPEVVKEPKQSSLPFSNKLWEYPPIDLLSGAPNRKPNAGDVEKRAKAIEHTLNAFNISAQVVDINIGPAVTRYSLSLAPGTKTSKVMNLAPDLALSLESPSGSVRVEAPIPGTNLVGIEVPNYTPSSVTLRSVMETKPMKKHPSKLAVALGHDVAGKPVIQDITRWPHCLIAGATGSGKSVMMNVLIVNILMRCSPSECRLIMIDPKMVEMSQYNGIPHLLTPVVTDVEQKAVSALAWAVAEMERRYKEFAAAGVRNIKAYNEMSGFQAEPYIVILIDEIADMMMVAASEVEKYITRLAQKSRAVGIHLILATQRPSVNILTGTIKANVPTRMSFKVTSQVDSRVIIDQAGAEVLIGRGDMLFVPPDDSKPRRIQGAFVSDEEVTALVNYLRNTGIEPDYKEEITQQKVETKKSKGGGAIEGTDEKMMEALELIVLDGKASASYLQRKLGVGYSRAARMIDDMEDAGIIGRARGSKPREVLVASVDEAVARLTGESSTEEDADELF